MALTRPVIWEDQSVPFPSLCQNHPVPCPCQNHPVLGLLCRPCLAKVVNFVLDVVLVRVVEPAARLLYVSDSDLPGLSHHTRKIPIKA